mmetsp:Transcript_26115/g.60643  ORF Transcript_26115/g.60643 Transcript_26115/m.60643 type:complete len:208 (-) Transcript_26115:299-922(-)
MQHASGCEEKPSGLPSCGRHPERLYEIQKIGGNIHGKTNTGPVAKTPTQDVKERTKKRVTHEISVGENKDTGRGKGIRLLLSVYMLRFLLNGLIDTIPVLKNRSQPYSRFEIIGYKCSFQIGRYGRDSILIFPQELLQFCIRGCLVNLFSNLHYIHEESRSHQFALYSKTIMRERGGAQRTREFFCFSYSGCFLQGFSQEIEQMYGS